MIPTGLPAWTRTSSHSYYGGDVNKHNFLSQGVIDPTTDVGAEELARLAADMEALVRVTPFATITYLNNDTSPGAPTIETVYMQTGTSLISYPGDSPPSGFPSGARNGSGDVTFTFLAAYLDAYGVSGAFSVKHVGADAQAATAIKPVPLIVTPQTVRVRCFLGGSAQGNARVTLEVW